MAYEMHHLKTNRLCIVFIVCLFSQSVLAASLVAKVERLDTPTRSGPAELTTGSEAHLLLRHSNSGTVIGTNGRQSAVDLSEVLFPSKNLVRGRDGKLRFGALDGASQCRVFAVEKSARLRKGAALKNCSLIELFAVPGGVVAWVQEEDGSHRLSVILSTDEEGPRSSLPGSGLFATGASASKTQVFVAVQGPTSNGNVEILSLSRPDLSLNGRALTLGAGATLSATESLVVVALNRKEGRYLIGYDKTLRKLWENIILKPKGMGGNSHLLVEDGRIYYISGNDNRLYIAVFDVEGRKLLEVTDEQWRYPLPIDGYAVTVDGGVLTIMGVIEVSRLPDDRGGGSSQIVKFTLNTN